MTRAGFLFDGVDPGVTAAVLLVKKRVGLLPELRRRTVVAGPRPGIWDFGTELGERRIELDLVTGDNANLAGTELALRTIALLFDPTKEVSGDKAYKQLIFDSENDRYWLAKISADPFTDLLPSAGRLTLALRCADPFAYAVAQGLITTGAGVAVIQPNVGGTYATPPTIELTAAAPFNGTLVLTSATTGDVFSWTGILAAADILKVDCGTYRAFLNGVVSMAGVVNGSKFPMLAPAQLNTINATGIPAASITQLKVTWRNRWI